jgi:hypothetical protein
MTPCGRCECCAPVEVYDDEPWPPDPQCTCGDYDEFPVCPIHIWIDPGK